MIVGFSGLNRNNNLEVTVLNTPIKIGVIAPLTGAAPELGEYITRGLELANSNLRNNIALVYEDDKCSDLAAAQTIAQKFINIDNIKFVIGPLCAGPYQAVAGTFNQSEVSFMHTSAVTPSFIQTSGEYGIPGLATDIHAEAGFMAEYAFDKLNVKKVGLLMWDQEWAFNHGKGFEDKFTELGGKVVFNEKFSITDKDFRTQITKLKNSGADAVYVVGLNFQNGSIVKQIRTLDKEIKIFGQFEIEDPTFLSMAGDGANGVIYVYPKIDLTRKETKDFIANFEEKFKTEPNFYSFVGFDALKLYDLAISKCGNDTKCVTKNILSSKNYPGVSGNITFDENKNIVRDFEIKTIEDRKFVKM